MAPQYCLDLWPPPEACSVGLTCCRSLCHRYDDLKQHADLYFLGAHGMVNFNNIKSVRPIVGMSSMISGKEGRDFSDYGLEVRHEEQLAFQCQS